MIFTASFNILQSIKIEKKRIRNLQFVKSVINFLIRSEIIDFMPKNL